MSLSLPFFSSSLVIFTLLFLVVLSSGAMVTATIDDTEGDSRSGAKPVYSPEGAFTAGTNCPNCAVHPDPAQAFDGTWHDSSQFVGGPVVSVTLSFTGTGIDVFCILANTIPGAVTSTDLSFTLDGASYPPFSHSPDSSSNFIYNAGGQVFSVDGLEQVPHQLVISTNPPAGSDGTLILFDFARYTFDDGTSPPQSSTQTGDVQGTIVSTHTVTTQSQVVSTQTVVGTSAAPPPSKSAAPSGNHSSNTAIANNPVSTLASNPSTSAASSPSTSPSSSLASSQSSDPAAQNSTLKTTNSKHTALLAGILVSVLLIALLVGLGLFLWRRRRAAGRNVYDKEPGASRWVGPMSSSHLSSRTTSAAGFSTETPFDATSMARGIPSLGPPTNQNLNVATGDLSMGVTDSSTSAAVSATSQLTLWGSSEGLVSSNLQDDPDDPPPQYDSHSQPVRTSAETHKNR